ncbi:MAG: hypothetical protein IKL79_01985 [Clostridia bacterium]|nr:hypothetical protein [Clostridia bacterium]
MEEICKNGFKIKPARNIRSPHKSHTLSQSERACKTVSFPPKSASRVSIIHYIKTKKLCSNIINPQALHITNAQALHITNAQALHITNAKALHITNAKALHITNAKALHITNAKALHITNAKALHTYTSRQADDMLDFGEMLSTKSDDMRRKAMICQVSDLDKKILQKLCSIFLERD